MLPDDIIKYIFQYLDLIDLLILNNTCKKFHEIILKNKYLDFKNENNKFALHNIYRYQNEFNEFQILEKKSCVDDDTFFDNTSLHEHYTYDNHTYYCYIGNSLFKYLKNNYYGLEVAPIINNKIKFFNIENILNRKLVINIDKYIVIFSKNNDKKESVIFSYIDELLDFVDQFNGFKIFLIISKKEYQYERRDKLNYIRIIINYLAGKYHLFLSYKVLKNKYIKNHEKAYKIHKYIDNYYFKKENINNRKLYKEMKNKFKYLDLFVSKKQFKEGIYTDKKIHERKKIEKECKIIKTYQLTNPNLVRLLGKMLVEEIEF